MTHTETLHKKLVRLVLPISFQQFMLALVGASIIIGNELGADNFTEAKRAGRVLTRASVICGLLSGIVLLALSPVIMKFVSMTIGGIFPAVYRHYRKYGWVKNIT